MNAPAQTSEIEIEIRKLRREAATGARKSKIVKRKAAAAKAQHKKARKLAKQAKKLAKQAAKEASGAKKALQRAIKKLAALKKEMRAKAKSKIDGSTPPPESGGAKRPNSKFQRPAVTRNEEAESPAPATAAPAEEPKAVV